MNEIGQHPGSTAFLLAQVGAHAAAKFAERMAVLGLSPAHAGTLRIVHRRSGITQQELSSVLGVGASRLVELVDELEGRGLVERRTRPEDRRAHALHLTRKGILQCDAIGKIARAHDEAICAALSAEEHAALGKLLARIADEQGLTPGVHPGFSRLGRRPPGQPDPDASRKPTRG